MALSTLAVAVHNTQCQVPFFVQVMDKKKQMYSGVFAGGGIRTDYQMIVLSRKPPQCGHLTGLLSMFKGKICSGSVVDIPSIRVTARYVWMTSLVLPQTTKQCKLNKTKDKFKIIFN